MTSPPAEIKGHFGAPLSFLGGDVYHPLGMPWGWRLLPELLVADLQPSTDTFFGGRLAGFCAA